jgi:hypothetical protein
MVADTKLIFDHPHIRQSSTVVFFEESVEITLITTVYDLELTLKSGIPLPSADSGPSNNVANLRKPPNSTPDREKE